MTPRFLASLLSLSLGAHPALAGPMEVPKLNPKVGSGMPGTGPASASSAETPQTDAAVVPTLAGGSLFVPDAAVVESAGRLPPSVSAAAAASPAAPALAAPAAKSVSRPESKSIGPGDEDRPAAETVEAPQVGSKEMRGALQTLTNENAKILEGVSSENPSQAAVRQAGVVGSVIFDAAKRAAGSLSDPGTAVLAPRGRTSPASGLRRPSAASGAPEAEPAAPAPARARANFHSRLNLFLGKAVYYMTAGSFGVIPRTFGQNAAGEPLIVLERRAVPYSRLLPRKLRHALFGRHWISIGVNEAPDFATKKELVRAFQSLGSDETLGDLKAGWAGGAAGYRAITSNAALISFAGRKADIGWRVLDYRTEASLGDRMMTWWQHPVESPAIAARTLWAKLRGRAPPEDPRRILVWEDPDPEPADRLPLYLLKLPFRFAGAVVREIFGDAAAVRYAARGLISLAAFRASPGRLSARANAVAFADPSRVLGVFDDKEIECQTASDCAVRATYNHPVSEPIRRTMDYASFLNFAEAAVGSPLRETGTSFDRRRAYMDLLGFESGEMRWADEEEDLLTALREDGPVLGRMHFQGSRVGNLITFQGWNPAGSHLVVINGAIRENGLGWIRHAALTAPAKTAWGLLTRPRETLRRLRDEGVWTFVVTDSNFRVPQRYTFRQLREMDLAVGTMRRNNTWQEGVGYRPYTPVELRAKIEKAAARYAGVRIPAKPGMFESLRRLMTGARWRPLPSDGPVLVGPSDRIELELGGRAWKGGKHLEILAVEEAKRRFENLRSEPELDENGTTHVLVDPLNPGQFRGLKRDGGELVLGRGSSGRFLFSERVSRAHLSIIPMGDRFILEDRDSANGTRIARVLPRTVDLSLENPTTRDPSEKEVVEELPDQETRAPRSPPLPD